VFMVEAPGTAPGSSLPFDPFHRTKLFILYHRIIEL